jgi:hypothetical protein
MDRYTFVTVTYDGEFELQLLQARSMQLYCPEALVHEVLVIDNSHPEGLDGDREARLRAAYGTLWNSVRWLPGSTVAKVPKTDGWRRQQVLKLAIGDRVETERYVVLDAKNHLVFPLKRSFLEAPDGRVRVNTLSFRQHPLRDSLERALHYFDLDVEPNLDRFTATTPPFVMQTGVVRGLLAEVARRGDGGFATSFLREGLTEFFAYTGYVLHRDPGGSLDDSFDSHQVLCPIVWDRYADDEGVTLAVEASRRIGGPFFGVHSRAMARLSEAARLLLGEFWCERALFPTRTAGADWIAQVVALQSRRRTPARLLSRARLRPRPLP